MDLNSPIVAAHGQLVMTRAPRDSPDPGMGFAYRGQAYPFLEISSCAATQVDSVESFNNVRGDMEVLLHRQRTKTLQTLVCVAFFYDKKAPYTVLLLHTSVYFGGNIFLSLVVVRRRALPKGLLLRAV